ncbi:hypothetical protein BD324DRAFT_637164 [Kockovaella imperatae]|uniref:Uncharacterized protein n=1 Tax=Kockovaella imperatae TaxID=4999 RepID=A0A1Y1U9K5_9TREE|nr:hypothetical protein BD324DRAFT_637164 [Kockovaella imperatae]ORX34224.1 hypothetical protein BD324DRAFT_637164 [Kockovaella imperatae]
MSRLASLQPRGKASGSSPSPSSPSSSSSPKPRSTSSNPSTPKQSNANTAYDRSQRTPSRQAETSHHRFLKLLLDEVKKLCSTWEDIMLVDGLKAGKGCVDQATEMDNILLAPLGSERPSIAEHLEMFYESQRAMDGVLRKLDRLIIKLSALIDQADKLFFEAHRTMGWQFVLEQPMWFSWTFETFVDSLSPLLSNHHTQLAHLRVLSNQITDPQTSFENAKLALEQWRDLAKGGSRWQSVRDWEELMDLEMSFGTEDSDDDMDDRVKSSASKKKKGR